MKLMDIMKENKMKNTMKAIKFPPQPEVIDEITKILDGNGLLYFTTTGNEFKKLKLGQVVLSKQLNCHLKIMGIHLVDELDDHPLYGEFTDKDKEDMIDDVGDMIVLKFKKIKEIKNDK